MYTNLSYQNVDYGLLETNLIVLVNLYSSVFFPVFNTPLVFHSDTTLLFRLFTCYPHFYGCSHVSHCQDTGRYCVQGQYPGTPVEATRDSRYF